MKDTDDTKIEVKIGNDVFGVGEIASSISKSVDNVIDNANIKKLSDGQRFFIITMLFSLVALILVPFLKIDAFSKVRFDILFYFWIGALMVYGSIFLWIDQLKKKK